MKWMTLLPIMVLLTACNYTNINVVEYQQVVVAPPCQTVAIVDDEPIDVTNTIIE